MYRIGRYDADDRMCDLVCDRYPVLLVMSRFGIALGFGDKTCLLYTSPSPRDCS